ncbi:hypothetical protein LCGC14_0458330, partial [marine sediment metagenome]
MQNGQMIRINEVFTSIDGEINTFGQGRFTTFIRFSGCNLDCSYCDTKYAQVLGHGKLMSVDQIVQKVKDLGCKKITITGGEPLIQKEGFDELTKKLWHQGFYISVETNGTIKPEGYGIGCWIVDYKLPSSGYYHKMKDENFVDLNSGHYVKFVIADKKDYVMAKFVMDHLKYLGCQAKFAFSPMIEIGGDDGNGYKV